MNILFLDRDPRTAAKLHTEEQIEECVVRYAEILCTALHITNSRIGEFSYGPTHEDHPCVIWASESLQNWKWLWLLGHHVGNEYSKKHKDIHEATRLLRCLPVPTNIKDTGWTDPPQVALSSEAGSF